MSRGYAAHESFWADAKMYLAMVIRAILIGMLAQVLVFLYGLSSVNFANIHVTGHPVKIPGSALVKYHMGIGNLIGDEVSVEKELQQFIEPWAGVATDRLDMENYRRFMNYLTNGQFYKNDALISKWEKISFAGYLFSPLYILIFFTISKRKTDKQHIRGAQLVPIKRFNKILAKMSAESPVPNLQIGDTIWPHEMESSHMLILGTSGSGKGVLLNQLVSQIEQRKLRDERCVFYDVKGEFISKQFVEGDLIFSPFDARCLRWSLMNEIEIPPDLDVIAKSLYINPGNTNNDYFYDTAADIFRTGIVYLRREGRTKNRDILNFFSGSMEEIKAAFMTLPLEERGALKHIDKKDANSSATVISVLQGRLEFLRAMVDLDGDFSFRKYIRGNRGKRQPKLFILNIDQYEKVFKPIMTLAIDVMIREALSLPDSSTRRIWFVIDELGTLFKLDSLIKLERVGRSKGACLVCANQDLGKVEEQYGKAELKSFFNNFNTTFTFCVKDPETAEFLSRAIGEQQLIKTAHSRQMSPSDVGDRKSESEQEKTERLVMSTELQYLPKFHAFINITGVGVSQMVIPHGPGDFFEAKEPHFIMRDWTEVEPSNGPGLPTEPEMPGHEVPDDSEPVAAKLKF